MSGNSSATGGYLKQQNVSLTDDAVMDLVTSAIVGITGMSGNLVRPRWQINPPRQPDNGTDWVAVAIVTRTPIDYPAIIHRSDNVGGGPDRMIRQYTYAIMVSMYGPNASGNAEALADALYIPQNMETLGTNSIKLLDVGEITAMPEDVNNQWYNRADLTVRFSVAITRDYNVQDIASASGTVTADDPPVVETWQVT